MQHSVFIPKVNMINFGVKCLETSKHFYTQVLDWSPLDLGKKNYAVFSFGSFQLGLYPLQDFEDSLKIKKTLSKFNGIALSINMYHTDQIKPILNKTLSSGGTILQNMQATHWGGKNAFISDPDGYLIELVYNPKWKLDSSGNLIFNSIDNQSSD